MCLSLAVFSEELIVPTWCLALPLTFMIRLCLFGNKSCTSLWCKMDRQFIFGVIVGWLMHCYACHAVPKFLIGGGYFFDRSRGIS